MKALLIALLTAYIFVIEKTREAFEEHEEGEDPLDEEESLPVGVTETGIGSAYPVVTGGTIEVGLTTEGLIYLDARNSAGDVSNRFVFSSDVAIRTAQDLQTMAEMVSDEDEGCGEPGCVHCDPSVLKH